MESKKKKMDVLEPGVDASNDAGPIKVLRLDDISVSVFRRDRKFKGQNVTFFSASFSRSYKDDNGSWKYAKNFDPEDLGKVMSLAKQASEFINVERGLTTVADEN